MVRQGIVQAEMGGSSQMNEDIVHPSFRPLNRRDKAVFACAVIMLLLGCLLIFAAGKAWTYLGIVFVIAGWLTYLFGKISRSIRMKNQV